jgi:hypothetical protein
VEELRLEIEALLDESIPASDLGLCFSYSITEEPYHTRLTLANTYDDIRHILEEMSVPLV